MELFPKIIYICCPISVQYTEVVSKELIPYFEQPRCGIFIFIVCTLEFIFMVVWYTQTVEAVLVEKVDLHLG